jgi:RNA polymerase sigma factor (sigma-70 family)
MRAATGARDVEHEGRHEVEPDDVFTRLFFGHSARLVRLASFLGAADPEDVVQEAFCKVFAGRRRLRPDEDDTVRYLTRAVVNEVRDRHRRAEVARDKAHLVPELDRAPSAATGTDPLAVREAVAALPHRQREAVVLRFWLDLSIQDVARTMGVRTGTAKSQLSRAVAALRESGGVQAPDGSSRRTGETG